MTVPLLIVTGPVGVGKTSVASEMSEILEERCIPHAAVDMDSLSWCFPRPPGDRFGSTVAFKNLAMVWRTFHDMGADRFIIPVVIESLADLDLYREAVPGAEITVARLTASPPTLEGRVAGRERGSGLEWDVARAVELAALFEQAGVEDFVVDTEGRSIPEVAHEVLVRAGWLE